jgi:hypothetical protein
MRASGVPLATNSWPRKNVGLLYYRLAMSHDPTSMLYKNIGGSDDLDRIDRIIERF